MTKKISHRQPLKNYCRISQNGEHFMHRDADNTWHLKNFVFKFGRDYQLCAGQIFLLEKGNLRQTK